jgi:hypothetical protein
MDVRLRNSIFNAIEPVLFANWPSRTDFAIRLFGATHQHYLGLCRQLWTEFLCEMAMNFPHAFPLTMRGFVQTEPWYRVYDLLEEIDSLLRERVLETVRVQFANAVTVALEREQAGYSFVEGCIVPILSAEEQSELESALAVKYEGAREHMRKAIQFLAERGPAADYENACKEAISAVESVCKEIADMPTATLGSAADRVAQTRGIHKALIASLKALYGFSSDEPGIRHGGPPGQVSDKTARFVVVSCAAWLAYLNE